MRAAALAASSCIPRMQHPNSTTPLFLKHHLSLLSNHHASLSSPHSQSGKVTCLYASRDIRDILRMFGLVTCYIFVIIIIIFFNIIVFLIILLQVTSIQWFGQYKGQVQTLWLPRNHKLMNLNLRIGRLKCFMMETVLFVCVRSV